MHALILSLSRVREADAMVDLLLETDLVVHAYARNFRTSRKFPNGLELFSVYEVALSPNREGSCWFNSAYGEQSFGLTGDLGAFSCASALLESVSVTYNDEVRVPGLFLTVLQVFAAMESVPELSVLAFAWAEASLLSAHQILPDLCRCSGCARPLSGSRYFEQEHGFVCETCAHGAENVGPHVYGALRRLSAASLEGVLSAALRRPESPDRLPLLHEVTRLLAFCLRDCGSRKSLRAHSMMGESVFGDATFLAGRAS